jgi:hypothetical protein
VDRTMDDVIATEAHVLSLLQVCHNVYVCVCVFGGWGSL